VKRIASLVLLTLTGCEPALDWQVIRNPGQPPIVLVTCEDRSECFLTVTHLCSHGFDIIDAGYQVDTRAQRLEYLSAGLQQRQPIALSPRWQTSLTAQCRVVETAPAAKTGGHVTITTTKRPSTPPPDLPPRDSSAWEPGF
jgi:hypothetical protein